MPRRAPADQGRPGELPRSGRGRIARAGRNPDGRSPATTSPVRRREAVRLAVLHGQVPGHAGERLQHLLRRARRRDRARFDGLLAVHAQGRWSSALTATTAIPTCWPSRGNSRTSGVVEDKWFIGYETEPRRLPLTKSGASIRSVPAGFELYLPPGSSDLGAFEVACAQLGVVGAENLVRVSQVDFGGRLIDTVDRIQLGADIVSTLADAGL